MTTTIRIENRAKRYTTRRAALAFIEAKLAAWTDGTETSLRFFESQDEYERRCRQRDMSLVLLIWPNRHEEYVPKTELATRLSDAHAVARQCGRTKSGQTCMVVTGSDARTWRGVSEAGSTIGVLHGRKKVMLGFRGMQLCAQ